MWGLVLLLHGVSAMSDPLLSEETKTRRTLSRFKIDNPDNQICWERHGVDGFISVIDTHNHFRPFGGPSVPFFEYLQWMIDHGLLFSTMFGIGQLLEKRNQDDPDCCYYLHCPTLNYTVVPNPENDRLNAEDFTKRYQGNSSLENTIHLLLSVTFPNLQKPEKISKNFNELEHTFPNAFQWAGEINVFKHALASNGFFDQERVTEKMIQAGRLDKLFNTLSDKKWPTTLHSDLGCDNYDDVPVNIDPRNSLSGCEVPTEELKAASQNHGWWKDMLEIYYHSFFDKQNKPRATFSKVQHLKIWDTLLSRYKNLTVVWAHLGLSKELRDLHPNIHAHILRKLFQRHENLHADVSWDVLAKQNLMNHDGSKKVADLHTDTHTDFNEDVEFLFNSSDVDQIREDLHQTWMVHEGLVRSKGSVSGPTHSMAIYLELFHEYPDRFLTGTDFVASLGQKHLYPGTMNKNGCMKDIPNHARQLTDTSSINMFFDDETFRKIVLGENFFRITQLSDIYAAPPVCGDSVLPLEAMIGIGVGVGVLVLVLLLVLIYILCTRGRDGGTNFSRVNENQSAATTNV